MLFGPITAQTKVYAPRNDGHYVLQSLTFAQPDDSFMIRPAAKQKSDPIRASVSRVLQKDVVVGTNTVRKTATVTCSVVVPSADFSASEIDSLITDLSEFLTPTTISEILMGKS